MILKAIKTVVLSVIIVDIFVSFYMLINYIGKDQSLTTFFAISLGVGLIAFFIYVLIIFFRKRKQK